MYYASFSARVRGQGCGGTAPVVQDKVAGTQEHRKSQFAILDLTHKLVRDPRCGPCPTITKNCTRGNNKLIIANNNNNILIVVSSVREVIMMNNKMR